MLSKTFRDSVHGYIALPHACVRIIDTPQFQRLRRVKQLSTAEYVFPNASHSRWEHSVGTAHVAGRIIRSIQEKQPEMMISAKDVETLQVAGLVHDIGHASYSHTFERVTPSFSHEENGCRIWEGLVRELGVDSEVDEFVQGCFCPTKRGSKPMWMYNLINNVTGGLDADRLDYCLRDAQIASVKIGFDLDRIIAGWRVEQDEFVFDSKLIGDVFAVHRARFLLYDTIYNHPVVKAIDMMMIDCLRLLLPDIDPTRDGDDVIYRFAGSLEKRHMDANRILERIHRRDLYKQVEEGNGGVPCRVVAHYGAGKENPLLRTRFSKPLDMGYIHTLCPQTFLMETTLYFKKT